MIDNNKESVPVWREAPAVTEVGRIEPLVSTTINRFAHASRRDLVVLCFALEDDHLVPLSFQVVSLTWAKLHILEHVICHEKPNRLRKLRQRILNGIGEELRDFCQAVVTLAKG